MIRNRNSKLVAALIAGGAAFGIATAVQASVPDSHGVIHSCYHVNGQGQIDGGANLRIIDPASQNKDGQACKTNEVELDWNQKGPTGAAGPEGPAAPQRQPGPQGPQGAKGDHGPKGDQGQTGPQGAQGPVGQTGPTGATGAQGPAGQPGREGPKGDQGPQGTTGPTGPAGVFSGTFTSPDNLYSLAVTDNGIELTGPGGSVQIDSGGIALNSGDTKIKLSGGIAEVDGQIVKLNGCSRFLSGIGDLVSAPPMSGVGNIVQGSATVCAG